MTQTTTTVQAYDALGERQPFRVEQDGTSGALTPHHVIETAGTPVGPTNPLPVSSNPTPSALSNSASGTMGTAAAVLVAYSATRRWLMVYNRTTGSETQDIGSSNVAVGGGIPLQPGGGFLFAGAGAAGPIYGITTVPNSPYSYVEA